MKGGSFFFIVCFLFIFSCKRKDSSFNENTVYRLYNLQNAGWKSQTLTHRFDEIIYRATAVPAEYYILRNEANADMQTIDSISRLYQSERVIEFEFEHAESMDLLDVVFTALDYDKSVTYISSTIQQDFFIVTESKDTITCKGVLFERHFKVTPFNRVLLYFEGINPEEQIQLLYYDHLFKNGIFKFTFSEIPLKT